MVIPQAPSVAPRMAQRSTTKCILRLLCCEIHSTVSWLPMEARRPAETLSSCSIDSNSRRMMKCRRFPPSHLQHRFRRVVVLNHLRKCRSRAPQLPVPHCLRLLNLFFRPPYLPRSCHLLRPLWSTLQAFPLIRVQVRQQVQVQKHPGVG
jgi:hypothetical protein